MPTAVMSSKGQIVIPAELRRRAQLDAGDRVIIDFDDDSDELRLRKAKSVEQQLDELSTLVTSWVAPGTPPLDDPRAFYRTRRPKV